MLGVPLIRFQSFVSIGLRSRTDQTDTFKHRMFQLTRCASSDRTRASFNARR